jgi:radical SAM protein (TIGR01212 family)
MNGRPEWFGERRFNAYAGFIRERFGGRVQKLAIDAGFTCPNRDGTRGRGGCTYCNNDAFNPSYCRAEKSVSRQINEGIAFHKDRYKRAVGYLAYFQAYSNTYAPLPALKLLYEEALACEGVMGLVIGTRPDCVNNEILDYLAELNRKYFVTVEYGIESCFDDTLSRINRGHDFKSAVSAVEQTASRGIPTGGHMIVGLPGEDAERLIRTAGILSSMPLHSLKFHQLQIVKGTQMGTDFQKHPDDYYDFGLDEYLELMVNITERLNPVIYLERIAGETVPQYNLRKSWGLRYDQILGKYEKKLEEKDTWQGRKYQSAVQP